MSIKKIVELTHSLIISLNRLIVHRTDMSDTDIDESIADILYILADILGRLDLDDAGTVDSWVRRIKKLKKGA